MALKVGAKFQGKLICTFQNDMRNLVSFHKLKNTDFILKSKMTELHRNKNSKRLDRPDAA